MENQFLDSNLDNETPQYSGYAGFWQRFVAALIDGIIMNIAQMIVFSVFGMGSMMSFDPEMFEEGLPTSFWLAYMISIGLNVAYFAYFESSEKQATFGKQAMGLVVTDINGNRISTLNAVGRYFAKIPSAMILLIGFIMQPFTQRKQALHDMIAGTLVYKK
ncbi:MAG: RDD family protein [Saprospiraceae bacterium]|nr:RDD family protein [Saprospiraceae bacterium]